MPNIKTVFAALILADALVVSAFLAVNQTPGFAYRSILVNFFDLNAESNFPTWYSSSKLLTSGLLMTLLAAATGFRRITPMAFALIFIAMSLDEAATVHERMGLVLSGLFLDEGIALKESSAHDWPYVYGIPMILIIAAVIYRCAKERFLTFRGLANLIVGIAVLLLGAFGVELIAQSAHSSQLHARIGSAPLITIIEEYVELFGSSIMIYACLFALQEKRKSVACFFNGEAALPQIRPI